MLSTVLSRIAVLTFPVMFVIQCRNTTTMPVSSTAAPQSSNTVQSVPLNASQPAVGTDDAAIQDCGNSAAFLAKDAVRIDSLIPALLCDKPGADPKLLIEELKTTGRIWQLDSATAAALGTQLPRSGYDHDLYWVPQQAETRLAQFAQSRPLLESGGRYAWLTLTVGIDGHWEVTERALRRVINETQSAPFQPSAITLVQGAAQDPDFYEWSHPQAHAQTDNDSNGNTRSGNAQAQWIKWVHDRLVQSLNAARDGDRATALYLLGYALHGIEDLAPHRGRTNAEHSFNAAHNESPDEDPAAIKHAEHLAYLTLRDMRAHYGPCWNWLGAHQGAGTLSGQQMSKLLGSRDFSLSAWWTYRSLAKRYERLPNKSPVRWCQPSQCQGLLSPILEGLPMLAAQCGNK